MGFYQADFNHLVKFNSATSSDFLIKYSDFVDAKIKSHQESKRSTNISPSSSYCLRQQWFKLRGTEPDILSNPDQTLNFTAEIGTACHEIIQTNLEELYGEDWIDVGEYIKNANLPYEVQCEKHNHETRLYIPELRIRCACDGLLRINGVYYLLEIKTSEYSSFDKLTDPKPQHISQINMYAAILKIPHVLVLYVDRQYGTQKCFELTVSSTNMNKVMDDIHYVLECAENNLAPQRLTIGDFHCNSNYCPYYMKCKEW